ncbi:MULTISPECIES: twin-arginine translocase subunit TatC [Ralstonia solanacearum species complex]|uniref:Sec-independent protein translocase protein TatC n=3 Tax=Ralstonia solanacearum species complex TaxID=3116862 RepID=A0AAD0WF57_RALSL|nr:MULTISPECIES: twin-arginine translocase subunit TatC [Ralstonia solanacearum species complex]BEU70882.1 twin-arginine translocase subunit TatC [Ralstonia pseudosolanacearum]AMP36462.1 twin-arginine protein translocation system subunit TatC [Ralstonia solanacearum]AXV75892.1 twin-arginine translocase subunit TatC [Ralstonia solanacearum]AXV80451.1 twin-arginine translocase subunit TatC [Ralstonia solanacearum]AXV85257.1 twin-arginine translocase subunit TatC [Ralstonia solanacearum]
MSAAPHDPQDSPEDGAQETFISHLVELRERIVKAGAGVLLIFLGLVYWAPDIFNLFSRPLIQALPKNGHMIVTDVTGSFFVPMKVTLLVAFLVALPWVLYQIWRFVAPGLYAHEKRMILPLVVSSYVLFLCGVAFAYFLVFPTVFKFMAHYNAPLGAEMSTDVDKYLSFAMTTFLAFGITFEVPVVVIVLVRFGIVSLEKLRQIRPYVVVGAFVIAAIVTPPDVMSQLLLAVPLWLLYELGLILAAVFVRKTAVPETETLPAVKD